MFRRRNNKEQEHKDVLEKEVAFWKTEMEKVVNEKNLWIEKFMKASEDNEMLRAELFFVQQDAQSTRAQLEVMRKREECRAAQSPAVGVGSSTGTPRSGLAGPAAATGFFGPSASSANSTPVKAPTPLHGGGGGGGVGVSPFGNGSYDRATIHQLEEQIVNLKAELARAHRQVAAAEAAAHTADMRVALLEERLVEAQRELEAARRQTEFMRTTAEAHQREADVLRSEVLSQRNINDETANETTKILSELSSTQQRCAKLASELSIKEQMVGLLQLQLGDMAAAAAMQTTSAGGAMPAGNTGTVTPAWTGAIVSSEGAMHHGRSMSLASAGWALSAAHVRTTSCGGAIGSSSGGGSGGGAGDEPCAAAAAAVTEVDHHPHEQLGEQQQQQQVELPVAPPGGGSPGGADWPPAVAVDDPEDGGQSPSLGVCTDGDCGAAGGDCDVIADGNSAASKAGASPHDTRVALPQGPAAAASAAAPETEPEPSGGRGSEAAVVVAASNTPPATGPAMSTFSDSRDSVRSAREGGLSAAVPGGLAVRAGAGTAAVDAQLAVPEFVGPTALRAAASSATAATAATAASVEVATAAAPAGPTFQEVAMQVDLNPSRQPPAVLRKSLSKGFAAATAAAGGVEGGLVEAQGGEGSVAAAAKVAAFPLPAFRQHHHYQQQRPANVPQLQLGVVLRGGRSAGSAATAAAVDGSGTPAPVTGKRGLAEQLRVDQVPAAKRSSVPAGSPAAAAVLSNDPEAAAAAAAAAGAAGCDAVEKSPRVNEVETADTASTAAAAATTTTTTTDAIAAAVQPAEVTVASEPDRAPPDVEDGGAAQATAAGAAEVEAAKEGTAAVDAENDPSSSSLSEEELKAPRSAFADEHYREPKALVASRDTLEPASISRSLSSGDGEPSNVMRIPTAGPDALAADVVATIMDPAALSGECHPKAAPTAAPASLENSAERAAAVDVDVSAETTDVGCEQSDPLLAAAAAVAEKVSDKVRGADVGGEGGAAAHGPRATAAKATEVKTFDDMDECPGKARENLCTSDSKPSPATEQPAAVNDRVDAAAAAAVATLSAPAVQAPKVFRFPGARMATAAAPSLATGTGLRGKYDGAASQGSDVPKSPPTATVPSGAAPILAKGPEVDMGGAAPGASTPPLVGAGPASAARWTEGGAPSSTPGGNDAATPSGPRSNTWSLLKRFNSGSLGSDASRAKSPAPEVAMTAAAAEGVFAGSGLSGVAAVVRRISSAGAGIGGATPTVAQVNGAGGSAPEPLSQPQQPTPPKRPTGAGVSTLMNRFNQVSGGGGGGATPPPPPPVPIPGNSIGSFSGISSTVVPEYGIGGPASRVPASAKIAAMRSAYERNKS